ncbi:MAG TPA: hypothetical protein DD412_03120, partial [Holosporales bacterium]|nr:hypothetical protein [Holosporales bacterium]
MISDVPIIQLDSKWAKRDEKERITLVLDIDGTLIEGDSTRKAAKKYVKKHFWGSFFNAIKGLIALIGLSSFLVPLLYMFLKLDKFTKFRTDIYNYIKANYQIDFPIFSWSQSWIQNNTPDFIPIPYVFFILGLLISLFLLKHTMLFIKLPPQSMRANYKQELAREINLTEKDILFIPNTIKLIQQEKERNRPIFLATGADVKYATIVRDALQKKLGFTKNDKTIGFIASTGKENIIGKNKAFELIKEFGHKNFIYVGNSSADLSVWEHCINP